jgi:hypothetical protein
MPGIGTDDWIEVARARMAARGKVKPATKAGAVRALWPAIQAALDNGQSLKSIRDWLAEEGVDLTYNQLTSYVGRIRRRESKGKSAPPQAGESTAGTKLVSSEGSDPIAPAPSPPPFAERADDPLANVRARQEKRSTFEYNPDFKEDELI